MKMIYKLTRDGERTQEPALTRRTAIKYADSDIIIKVDGGYAEFETWDELQTWRRQK